MMAGTKQHEGNTGALARLVGYGVRDDESGFFEQLFLVDSNGLIRGDKNGEPIPWSESDVMDGIAGAGLDTGHDEAVSALELACVYGFKNVVVACLTSHREHL